jgi:hypothetical protein
VAILDVTNPAAPAAAGELDVPEQAAGGVLSAIVGTAALMTASTPISTQTPPAQTVTVVNFADPEHSTVVRRFSGVTAILKDSARDLIYLAGSDTLWVLRVKPAADPQMEKAYAQYVLYDR